MGPGAAAARAPRLLRAAAEGVGALAPPRAPRRAFFSFARAAPPPPPPPAPPPPPPPLAPPPDGHRAFGAAESRFLAAMARAPPYAHATNPGVRVLPDFLSPREAAAALAAVDEAVLPRFGLAGEHAGDAVQLAGGDAAYAALVLPRVNTARATGRAESARQTLAPWGYGDAFDARALPPALGALVARLAAAPGFALGAPRDVTVNVREAAFFKLDPHVDPAGDGATVFIVSLGPSPTVLTFSPPPAPGAPRRAPADVSLASWSDADIDALSLPRSAVAFSGAARWAWRHATRTGVLVDEPAGPVACDWFGSTDRLLPRRPGRRVSVVVAFGAKGAG
jgi:hypothetical protein